MDNREKRKQATTISVTGRLAVSVKLTRCYFECPRCIAIKPAQDFGLRLIEGIELRNQSHCKACRAEQLKEKTL